MKKTKEIAAKITKNGFYIILFLCICAIGISGYVMFYTPETSEDTLSFMNEAEEFSFPEQNVIDFEPVISSEPINIPEEKAQEPAQKEDTVKSETKESTPSKTAAPTVKEVTAENKKIAYVKPVDGEVSQPFSGDELIKSKTMGDWRVHAGVDISAPAGTKVCAIADGTVTEVFEDEMMGHTVKIRHKEGCVSTYSNLMKGITVKKGDKVEGGQVIGGIGESAIAESMEAPHLHLELCENNVNIDPMTVIG